MPKLFGTGPCATYHRFLQDSTTWFGFVWPLRCSSTTLPLGNLLFFLSPWRLHIQVLQLTEPHFQRELKSKCRVRSRRKHDVTQQVDSWIRV
jgi:hypothetical protein